MVIAVHSCLYGPRHPKVIGAFNSVDALRNVTMNVMRATSRLDVSVSRRAFDSEVMFDPR
jgi:hypothetical protein